VAVGDLAPVVDARAAERVGADAHARLAHGVEVEHRRQVVDVAAEEVVRSRWCRRRGPRQRHPAHALHAGAQQGVGGVLHGPGDVAAGGPPSGGLYLKPPSPGVVGRRDDDAVGQPLVRPAVVGEHGVREAGVGV
jgi:hypothetical protein